MVKIRPEQMGHKALLRRGRSARRLQYTFLITAAVAAAATCFAAFTMN